MNSGTSNDPDPVEPGLGDSQSLGSDQDPSELLRDAQEQTRQWEEKDAAGGLDGTLSSGLPGVEIFNDLDDSSLGIPALPPDPDKIDPTQIGRYEVIRKLGEGGFGSVYLTHDPMLNRKVAIKLPRSDLSPSRRNSFTEEGRAIKHPSIVNIFNIEMTDRGDPFDRLQRAALYLCSFVSICGSKKPHKTRRQENNRIPAQYGLAKS